MKIHVEEFGVECDGDGCDRRLRDMNYGLLYFKDDEQFERYMEHQEAHGGWRRDGDKAYCRACGDALFGEDG